MIFFAYFTIFTLNLLNRTNIKQQFTYQVLSSYYLRTPLFSLDFLYEFLQSLDFENLLKNQLFLEAIYVASPALYDAIDAFTKSKLKDSKKERRLKFSLVKYLTRMCARPTPFGLFSACGLGNFDNATHISLNDLSEYKRISNLDMMILEGFKQELLKIDSIKEKLKFYPNNSIYDFGNQHSRYVEYRLVENQRFYDLQELEQSPYLLKILSEANHGKTIAELSMLFVDEGMGVEEVKMFIEKLISNQLLISEIELTTTGKNYFERLIAILEQIQCPKEILMTMKQIQKLIRNIDLLFGNPIEPYQDLHNIISKITPNLSKKNNFQTDVFLSTSQNTLSYKVKRDLLKTLSFFCRINKNTHDGRLAAFKEAFVERYGEEAMPLSLVLDSDVGIGYGSKNTIESPLLKKLMLENQGNLDSTINWSEFDELILNEFIECLTSDQKVIKLKYNDFKHLKAVTDDLPTTFSAIVEIYQENYKDKLYFNWAGGAVATQLMGRFSQNDAALNDFLQNVVAADEKMQPECIFAAIVHLPEARTGNILNTSNLRKYEIPYLGFSSQDKTHQILLNDLLVSVKHNRLVITSKSLNKEVVPRLDNAHNYSIRSLPVYEFLCDLQFQGVCKTFGFQWNSIFHSQPFLPRVELDDVVVSKARWTINSHSFLETYQKDPSQLQNKYKLPRRVEFIESDQRLMIDFQNHYSISLLVDTIKKLERFALEEFVFSEMKSPVMRNDEKFCNQAIISFSKNP